MTISRREDPGVTMAKSLEIHIACMAHWHDGRGASKQIMNSSNLPYMSIHQALEFMIKIQESFAYIPLAHTSEVSLPILSFLHIQIP